MKNIVASSIAWSAVERFSVQGIQFILSIIITRLVLPSDYGLIAMLGIFLAIAQTFIDSGFSVALIQKQNRTNVDYSTVFYFNVAVGILSYLFLCLLSPYIASFYGEPRLEMITKVVSLNLVINSLMVVQRAILTVSLNFKRQALASLIAVFVSGVVGVWTAYIGCGVWALIFQTLLNNLLTVILLWIFAKWLPLLCFSWQSFRYMFGFGSKLLAAGLLHMFYTNMYTLVIGKCFSASDLGFYSRANSFSYVVSGNLSEVLNRVAYPVQCQLQNDDEQLRAKTLYFMRMACFVIFPLMIGMAILAKPLVQVILTDTWLFTADLLPILSFAYMWDILMRLNFNILTAKRSSRSVLISEVLKKISAILLLVISIPFGLEAMCWSLFIYSLTDLFIITQYTKKIIGIGILIELKAIFPLVLLASSMGIFLLFVDYLILVPAFKLLTGLLVGGSYYLGIAYLFRFKELFTIINLIRKK